MTFFKRIFFGRIYLKLIERQEKLWGSPGACFPEKLKNLHAVMAILVLFDEFSSKFCLHFWTLILSASPNMMPFVRTFFIKRT